ncbi:unnamed protein product [Rotaria sp. Silwood2]|nr:unnamed protein product [Rotaria sp. Silwood2]CAF3267563.1 unnamed protein product [Rotaria sp. Silwood2]CAF3448923.1 unnamed protein product [Rotaria sp. Silwood2]CAF4058185.1 unnamed protein product [Rotaria sp. Silwood2]CAF4497314.1 unnamed protein product [Rotaria sp. Silwood2]
MVRIQTVLLVVAVAFLVMANTSVNGQCYTSCISGGCCPSSHPQCCVANGVKLCCRVNRALTRASEADLDESTSPRYNLVSQ